MNAPMLQYSLEEKVDFLSQPTAYTERTRQVVTRETHMSWVFLTDRYAYKLKKPVRHDFLDYSSVEARGKSCEEEVRLNRRLAEPVYVGVVSLVINASGVLQLGGEGSVVDWLVKMQRLSEEHMLDHAIKHGIVSEVRLQPVVQHLVAFYQKQPPVPITLKQYAARLEEQVIHQFQELAAFDLPKPLNPEILAR